MAAERKSDGHELVPRQIRKETEDKKIPRREKHQCRSYMFDMNLFHYCQ